MARAFCGSSASARSNIAMASFKVVLFAPLKFNMVAKPRIVRSRASGSPGRSRSSRRTSALLSSHPSELARRATTSNCNLPRLLLSPWNSIGPQMCAGLVDLPRKAGELF